MEISEAVLKPEELIVKYICPLFFVDDMNQLVIRMSKGTIIYGLLTLFASKAPYGRYSDYRYGFGVPVKFAWAVQEFPSFFVPVLLCLYRNGAVFHGFTNMILLGMFVLHYFHRTFIFPAFIKSKNSTPFLPFISAFVTCLYNGILHGIYFIYIYEYEDHVWFYKPNFYIGVILYLYGLYVNIRSDSTLRNLRTGCDTGYKIPQGGMFEYVSCANYFGEIVEMWGYAIASLAFPAVAHAIFTTLFLSHRAMDHHGWYLKKFENYPKHRKSVIPFLI